MGSNKNHSDDTEAEPMGTARPVFLHGLESGPKGSKFRSLVAAFPNLFAPDCKGIYDADERLARIESALEGQSRLLLIGSSFGGLMACLFASRHPERVVAAVLCAPALHERMAGHVAMIEQVAKNCVIIHGVNDTIVPVQASRRFAARFAVELVEVHDDHRLARSHGVILEQALRWSGTVT